MDRAFWQGRRVFLTGHTGFKGGWLALWLADMGAEMHGYALEPPTIPIWNCLQVERPLGQQHHGRHSRQCCVGWRHAGSASGNRLASSQAQSLVRASYCDPVATYAVNVMGTVNLLEAVRHTSGVRAVVNVTTDNVTRIANGSGPIGKMSQWAGIVPIPAARARRTRNSRLPALIFGGSECSHRQCPGGQRDRGGDWAADRLIPDFLRSIDANAVLVIRSPGATRPWQHVLEPLSGYLTLAEKLYGGGDELASGWNFGPEEADARPVSWIVEKLCGLVPGARWRQDGLPQP